MPLIESNFKPAWWLRGDHAQTLWPAFFRWRRKLTIRWERLELEDGDFLDLAWSGPEEGPIVLFFHGLQGSVDSHYAPGMMHRLNQHGFRVCLMHFRGCGREPNRLPISYHSGKTDDPQWLLEHMIDRYGQTPYAAIGVSLGGNVLLKWLGEQGARSPLQKAVAVSVPFRLDAAADRLDKGLSRLYQRHLVNSLKRTYRRKFAGVESPLGIDLDKLGTFRQFDDQITAALHGFNGVDDYYARCSSRQFIPGIRIQTLILHARRDPFMFPSTPPEAEELPEQVFLEIPQAGGHVGFVSGNLPGWGNYYAEQRVTEWLTASRGG